MKSYDEYKAQDRRLAILKILHGVHERRSNQYILRTALRAKGHDELVSTVSNDLQFLRKQGLVLLEELEPDLLLVVLTDFGDQVARGVARAAGVAVPAVE
jgi:hypothetical protein